MPDEIKPQYSAVFSLGNTASSNEHVKTIVTIFVPENRGTYYDEYAGGRFEAGIVLMDGTKVPYGQE